MAKVYTKAVAKARVFNRHHQHAYFGFLYTSCLSLDITIWRTDFPFSTPGHWPVLTPSASAASHIPAVEILGLRFEDLRLQVRVGVLEENLGSRIKIAVGLGSASRFQGEQWLIEERAAAPHSLRRSRVYQRFRLECWGLTK
jgi:hypothetical protein